MVRGGGKGSQRPGDEGGGGGGRRRKRGSAPGWLAGWWAPARLRRLLPLLALAASSVALFILVGRESSYLDIDSGPYLSMAHHVAAQGRPVASFNFVGNFERLPGYPNFVPPGLGLLVGLLLPLTGDPVTAGRVVLFAALLTVHAFAYLLLLRRGGGAAFALGATLLLAWNLRLAEWAALILTELPFMACLAAALWAATVVLGKVTPRREPRVWAVLTVFSAALPLVRYLGVFFAPTFSVLYLGRALHRGRGRRAVLLLSFYNLAAFAPLALWLLVVRAGGSPLLPHRPPSRLTAAGALGDAAAYLGTWLWPYLAAAAVVWLVAKAAEARGRRSAAAGPVEAADLLPAAALVGYLAVLIVARTGSAYYPLDELGYRYMVPAWPLAFLAGALAFHRWIWRRRTRTVRVLAAAGLVAALFWQGRLLAERTYPPPFPSPTQTFQQAVDRIAPGDGVLTNFGQPFAWALPEARVVGIPSRLDFVYSLDLAELAQRHEIRWLVLFPVPGADELYGGWFRRWLAAPPAAVEVSGSWRYGDGVIYRLE